jgi:transcriptional regulator with XRE-family HTH domain
MSTLAERIKERLQIVRKSAAAVSIEAGLGRSAVQDIISGNSNSPRLDTLEKLTKPLQCSIQFLVTGSPEEEGLWVRPSGRQFRDLRHDPIRQDLESGVFRKEVNVPYEQIQQEVNAGIRPEYPVSDDPRIPGHRISPYRMLDDSLVDIGIFKNDILWGAEPPHDQIDLFDGQVVIIEHRLDAPKVSEWTARQVKVLNNGFALVPRASGMEFDGFEIESATIGLENYYHIASGTIVIRGMVAAIYRELPIRE